MSSFLRNTLDKTCLGCGERMWGIFDFAARHICEECGGNKTEYSAKNPKRAEKENEALAR